MIDAATLMLTLNSDRSSRDSLSSRRSVTSELESSQGSSQKETDESEKDDKIKELEFRLSI